MIPGHPNVRVAGGISVQYAGLVTRTGVRPIRIAAITGLEISMERLHKILTHMKPPRMTFLFEPVGALIAARH